MRPGLRPEALFLRDIASEFVVCAVAPASNVFLACLVRSAPRLTEHGEQHDPAFGPKLNRDSRESSLKYRAYGSDGVIGASSPGRH